MINKPNEYYNVEDLRALYFENMNALLEMAGSHGFRYCHGAPCRCR